MKVLNIGGKDYTFEFSIEASMNDECIEKTTSLLSSFSGEGEEGEEEEKKEKDENKKKETIYAISNLPKTTMSMFYAGLLEHHGVMGDRTILSENDAKVLIRQYFEEHKDDGTDNFYSIMEQMVECMGDDGFFKRIGLEKMTSKAKEAKIPQDHKKKVVKVTGK